MRIGVQQLRPGLEQRSFFAFQRASSHDQPQLAGSAPKQPRSLSLLGGAHIELQISGDRNPLRLAANGLQPVGIGLALCKYAAEAAQKRPPNPRSRR